MSVRMNVVTFALVINGLAGLWVLSFLGASEPAHPANCQPAQPTGVGTLFGPDHALLQKRVQQGAIKASVAVVRIGNGSGVIISSDGLILTQRHVVSIQFPQATLGTKIAVQCANGTQVQAELLGVDPLYDLAALRLTGPGPYPHCPLAENGPGLGDPLLKVGHPAGGPTEGRLPVVRFCRVLVRTDYQFICDCLVNGGDSGGPFVDLEGRVVGLQGPVGIGPNWPTLKQPTELLAVEKLERRDHYLDTGRAAPLLHKRLPLLVGRAILPATEAERAIKRADDLAMETAPILPVEEWCQAERSLSRFQTAGMSASVVQVLGWDDQVIALGTVVASTGLILTTAAPAITETAHCPERLRCRLPGGTPAAATVVGLDPDYNLALLRIRADGLKPVEWAAGQDQRAGMFLSAVGANGLPLVDGVLGVERRQIFSPRPVPLGAPSVAPLKLSLQSVPGNGGFRVESCEGNALAYGFRPNDLVVSLDGKPVRSANPQDLIGLPGHRAGDRVAVQIRRKGELIDLSLLLSPDSNHRDSYGWDFYPPVAFEGDLPILQSEHGCPVVGPDGKVVGVAVGRIQPHACIVVPTDRVLARLADLKIGKPQPGISPAPNPAARTNPRR